MLFSEEKIVEVVELDNGTELDRVLQSDWLDNLLCNIQVVLVLAAVVMIGVGVYFGR